MIKKIVDLIRHIVGDAPKFLRIAAFAMFAIVMFIGLYMSVALLGNSVGSALMMFIYYLLLATGSLLIIFYAWKLYQSIIRKATLKNMDEYYALKGNCKEMADTLNAISPAPSDRDRALLVFLLVMAEHYEKAEQEISRINETTQDSRDLAMILTAKFKLYLMTNRVEKAVRLFDNHSDSIEFSLESQPDLYPEYRVYSDDTFQYYMLAAVYSILSNHPEKEADYRKRAQFQLSKRNPGESKFYTGLLELNALYARGKTQEAYDYSHELFMLTEQGSPAFLQSEKDEMRRALEQAKIFASYHIMIEENDLTERNLPPELSNQPLPEELGFTAL